MLSPDEIRSRTFLVSLRGYDREEVAAFLEEVADYVAQLDGRLQLAEAAAAAAVQVPEPHADERDAAGGEAPAGQPVAGPFAQIAQETERILEAAQQAGEEMLQRARDEAEREVKAARSQATKIIAEGERRREETERAVAALEEMRGRLAEEFRGLGRTVERVLRDLAPAEDAATTVREALAEAARGEDAGGEAGALAEAETAEAEPAEAETHVPEAEAEVAGPEPEVAGAEPGEAEPAEPEREAEPAPAAAEGEAEPEGEEPVPSTVGAAAAEPGQARADALGPLHPKLVRRLKRGLQDIQNVTLDGLRRDSGHDDPERFLPDQGVLAALGDAADEFLRAAYVAGRRAGSGPVAGTRPAEPEPAEALGPSLARELGERILEDLRGTLGRGFERGEDLAVLSDRVEAVFAGLRDGPVGDVSAAGLKSAYEWGLHDAWHDAEIPARQWLLAAEPPCSNPRCVDNAKAGPVPFGKEFPSGHQVPPAAPGCSCTTTPSTAVT